ncbi:MAG TPA: sulfotransferase domain-containing protein [Anaerolineales bacterium]|nr:sulfotransferase domain-containing protein [Anaerolineales bacterium]
MIILSVGMPRAGSGWHYNLVHDLMKTAGATDASDIRQRYRLQSILTEINNNIGVLSARRLVMVTLPALMANTFVIKAHAGPTSASRILQSLGLLRITYIYRDPRDAMLSAFEYGQRGLQRGRPNAFSHLTDFQKSLDFIMDYVRIWDRWTREKNIFITRYEDLQTNYQQETARLVKFLKLNEDKPEVQKVIEEYHQPVVEGQKGLHFNKGKIGRFREAYTAQEQAILQEKMDSYLPRMGYQI